MAKKNEDNRDVFEKALDYAAPAAGMYLGGKAGIGSVRKILRAGSSRSFTDAAKKLESRGQYVEAGHLRSMNNSARIVSAPFAAAGGLAGLVGVGEMKRYSEKRRRK